MQSEINSSPSSVMHNDQEQFDEGDISNSLDTSTKELVFALNQCMQALENLAEEAKQVNPDFAQQIETQLGAVGSCMQQF